MYSALNALAQLSVRTIACVAATAAEATTAQQPAAAQPQLLCVRASTAGEHRGWAWIRCNMRMPHIHLICMLRQLRCKYKLYNAHCHSARGPCPVPRGARLHACRLHHAPSLSASWRLHPLLGHCPSITAEVLGPAGSSLTAGKQSSGARAWLERLAMSAVSSRPPPCGIRLADTLSRPGGCTGWALPCTAGPKACMLRCSPMYKRRWVPHAGQRTRCSPATQLIASAGEGKNASGM